MGKTIKNQASGKTPVVHVALSGGVDSAVAALLLKEQGYNVTGIFMKNWSGTEYGLDDICPWKEDQEMAQAVSDHLDIPFKTYNFEPEYREYVIDNFFSEYHRGNTPNPDVLCNKFIKFGHFLEKSLEEGADYIATGHYAKIIEKNETYHLQRAADQSKDQTYFLYRITQNQLSHTLFPLGSMVKNDIREIARQKKLPNADRKDSQGICFVGKIDVQEFLQKRLEPKEGDIIDLDTNKIIGTHRGVWYYTLGQREGLRIGGVKLPYYVAKKDVASNILYAASGKDNPALYSTRIFLEDIHWISNSPKDGNYKAMVRYRQNPAPCRLEGTALTFPIPIWNPSPGQSAIIIDGDDVLGGGVVTKIER